MSTLTYDLLLRLSGGDASVVERLTPLEVDALWVETPVAAALREAATQPEPRHIFLSGGAGDGKTTLIRKTEQAFDRTVWHVEQDASTMTPEALRDSLTAQLKAGKRLLVAINRGQLERLIETEPGEQLGELLHSVRAGLRLRVEWGPGALEELGKVLTIDLSLQDNFHAEVFGAVLDKACAVQPPACSLARRSLQAAVETLRQPIARRRLLHVGQAIQAEGHRATLRQLWELVSHLLTGGRPDDPAAASPLAWTDHVGCRLFRQSDGPGEVRLVELALEHADPARTPQPGLTRVLLERGTEPLPHPLADHLDSGMRGVRGVDVVRALWLQEGGEEPSHIAPVAVERSKQLFHALVQTAATPAGGWTASERGVKTLLPILAALVGQPLVGQRLPAWRRLAYEERKRSEAPLVARAFVDSRALRFGRPRPSPGALRALGGRGRYFVAYLWLTDDPGAARGNRLRLTPAVLRAGLAAQRTGAAGASAGPEVMAVRAWLARARTEPLGDTADVYVFGPSHWRGPDRRKRYLELLRGDPVWDVAGPGGGLLTLRSEWIDQTRGSR